MTLNEAIEHVINIEGKPLSARQIAIAINELAIYNREDGKPLDPSQIAARVENSPSLFEKTSEGHVFIKKETQIQYQRLVYQLQDLLRSNESRNTDVIIATYLFLERVRAVHPDYLHKFKNNSLSAQSGHNRKPLQGKYNTGFEITEQDESLITDLFQNLSPDLELRIFDLINQYNFSLDVCSHIQFGKFFNDLLKSSSLSKGALGDFATPTSVSRIIADIAEIKKDDYLFDPFGGIAGIFVDVIRTKGISCKLKLNDIDKYCVWLGKMNLVVNNILNFEYNYQNSIDEYIYSGSNLTKYDWIITHPPFGTRFSKEEINSFKNNLFGKTTKPELLILELIMNQLKDNGKAVIIVPEAFLFVEDKANINARKFLIEKGWLKAVISLPTGAFLPYTSAKASILLIDKSLSDRIPKGSLFVELSDDELEKASKGPGMSLKEIMQYNPTFSAFVKNEEIEEERNSLVANRFIQKKDIAFPDDHIQLKKLIRTSYSGYTYSQKYLNKTNGIPYVNIKDLSNDKEFYYLNKDKIDIYVNEDSFGKTSNHKVVPHGAILIAKIGNKLKPTFNATALPIAVSGNILVLEPDNKIISNAYLISQFHKDYVLQQVDRIRGGAAQPFVRIDDLLNIYIKVPTIKEQDEEGLKFGWEQMQNTRKEELQKAYIEKEDIDLTSAIEHEYKNLKNPLSSNISNIKDFLEDKIQRKESISWNDKIAITKDSRTIQTVFSDITGIMIEMSSLIEDIVTVVNLEKRDSILHKRNVLCLSYFKDLTTKIGREFPEAQLELKYVDKKVLAEVLLQIDDNLFTKVLRNFVSNSLIHGYKDSKEKPVYILLTVTDDELNLQIDLINNGKPFDEGFTFKDFISFGKKTGRTKGSGIGGFIMNQIVLHHNGIMEMVTVEEFDLFGQRLNTHLKSGVHFRIKLPIVK